MVKIALMSVVLAVLQCSQPFVMKPKEYTRPVMVGEVRQLGGDRVARDAENARDFSAEIEILDTPVSSSHDWYVTQDRKFDHKLTAASVFNGRDTIIDEMSFGSYVFNGVLLFYLDKDWIRLTGHSEYVLSTPPERVYILNPVPRKVAKGVRAERPPRAKKAGRRPASRRRR